MCDPVEEQEQEIQALQAIYPNELTIVSISSGDVRFTIDIKCETSDGDTNEPDFSIALDFTLPPSYPNEVPAIRVRSTCDVVFSTDADNLKKILDEESEKNLGMVMTFTLVSSALEWLNKLKDDDIVRRKEAADKAKRELEEAERKKFEGTRVTVESFMRWKMQFDQEMSLLAKKQQESEPSDGPKKLTGRELFEKDKSLNESDLKFIEEDKDISYDITGVKVDTKLFEDLDDLDIEDEDDEDYDPEKDLDDDE